MKATPFRLTDEQSKLAGDNYKLALAAANRMRRRFPRMDIEDIVSACNEGLCHAARKHDPSKGFAFSTYAWQWMLAKARKADARRTLVEVPEYLQPGSKNAARTPKNLAFANQALATTFNEPRRKAYCAVSEDYARSERGIHAVESKWRPVGESAETKDLADRALGVMRETDREIVKRHVMDGESLVSMHRGIEKARGMVHV